MFCKCLVSLFIGDFFSLQIRVSLTTNSSGICTRKYKPALQPSTTTNIVLSYAIQDRTVKNALLLYLGSHNSVGLGCACVCACVIYLFLDDMFVDFKFKMKPYLDKRKTNI